MSVPNVVACPHCGGQIAADPNLAGKQVACPHCKRPFPMPVQPIAGQAPPPIPSSAASTTSDPLDFLNSSAPSSGANGLQATAVKRWASEGVHLAHEAVGRGTKALKQTFGDAVRHTKTQALVSFGHLVKHPLRLVFLTTLFIIVSGMTLGTLVAAVLFPVFVMGYIACVRATVAGEQMAMADFIGFMRHGWDSFWHLLMLLAAFFVTLAAMIAPVVIVMAVLGFTLGTVGSFIGEIGSHGERSSLTSHNYESDHFAPSSPRSGEPSKLMRAIGDFFGDLLALGLKLILLIVLAVILTPIAASLILFFFLVQEVAGNRSNVEQRFDLVYQAFVKMLETAKTYWKELFISGLFCSCCFMGIFLVVYLLSSLLAKAGLYVLASWTATGVMSVALFIFIVYMSVFVTVTCLSFSERKPVVATP
jgi:hypothetical protein